MLTDLLSTLQVQPVDPNLTAELLQRYRLWMTVSGVGEIIWLPAYFWLIAAGFRQRTNTMPLIALLVAIPLNFTFSFVCDVTNPTLCPHTPMGNFMDVVALWVWRLCFALSLVLLWQYFRSGRDHPQDVAVPSRAAPWVIPVGLAMSFAFQYSFLLFELDFNGNQLYFMVTLAMSASFVLFALARPEGPGLSIAAGWSRLISETLMVLGVVVITYKAASNPISLYPGYENASHAFVYVMAASIVLLDAVYVAILHARRRA